MIFLNELDENWIVDRFRREWYEFNGHYSTTNIKEADIIWIIAPWTWKKIPKHLLKSKKVICTVHHIDESKFKGKSKKIFFKRDKYVDVRLPPRTLQIVSGRSRFYYEHSIPNDLLSTERRVSLTFRSARSKHGVGIRGGGASYAAGTNGTKAITEYITANNK